MTTGRDKRADDRFFLPDLCTPAAVLGVVLIAELAAIALTLARQPSWDLFFTDLAAVADRLDSTKTDKQRTSKILKDMDQSIAEVRGSIGHLRRRVEQDN